MHKLLFIILLLASALISRMGVAQQIWTHQFGPYGGDVEAIASDRFGHIYAGTDSGAFVSSDNGATWVEKNNGLTTEEIFSFTCTPLGTVLAGTEGGGIFRSTNFGDTWATANSGLPDSSNILSLVNDERGNIYAGHSTQGVFYSADDGEHWVARNTGMPDRSVYVMTVAQSGNLYAGVTKYTLESTDRGEHWLTVDSLFPPGDEVLALAADSAGNVFAGTFKGFRRRAVDRDTTVWEDITPPAAIEVRVLAAHGRFVFAGLFGGGIFLSRDKGTSWDSFVDDTLTDNKIYSLTVSPSEYLFTGTFLADVFRTVRPLSALAVSAPHGNANVAIWPQPCENEVAIELASVGSAYISIYDIAGVRVRSMNAETNRATIDLTGLASGVYSAVIRASDGMHVCKIVKR